MSLAGEYQVMTLKQLKYFCNNHKKWRLCPKICVGRAFSDFSAADFCTFCLVWTLGSHALSLKFFVFEKHRNNPEILQIGCEMPQIFKSVRWLAKAFGICKAKNSFSFSKER